MAFDIRPLASLDEAKACARMMAGSEPWITLGRGYAEALALVQDPAREVFVASGDGAAVGFVILNMAGAFVGYVQTICVAETERSPWNREPSPALRGRADLSGVPQRVSLRLLLQSEGAGAL